MTVSDPIADMLTRIRNATMARHEYVEVPGSKIKVSIAKIMKDEGFISDYDVTREKDRPEKMIKIHLRYIDTQPAIGGLQRISKPGLRMYVERQEIPRVYGGLGIAILSTAKGVRTGQEAWRLGVGGELLCYVW